MVFPIIDTPRSEIGDQTRFSNIPDLDFSTVNSIPSPSKDSNDLLRQIRNMRGPSLTTPRARPPFGDRRNGQSKNEFTPLLKSAARNNIMRSGAYGKENSVLQTPAGLKAGYGVDSPGLPLNSSVMMEDVTGSSADAADGVGTPLVPGVSSSVASTPMALLPKRGDGPLDNGRNLATLREQEARLEQIDKENFSLKLKIHFMEEALRKNGKEFNEAAIKENTELKVDKVTLQRDLKQNRKTLVQAQTDLEEYRKQFAEYAEKVKRRHVNEGMQEELDKLKQTVASRETEIEKLQGSLSESESQKDQVEKLQDELNDLEAELREKDRELDAKDEELQALHESESPLQSLQQQLRESKQLIEENREEIGSLQDELNAAASESQRKIREKDESLGEKSDEVQHLQEQLKNATQDQSSQFQAKVEELSVKVRRIQELESSLSEAREAAEEVASLKEQLQQAENTLGAETRKKNRMIEDRDFDLHALRQKLESAELRDHDAEKMQDDIADLEAELRQKDRLMEDKEAEIDELKELIQSRQQAADQQLRQTQERVEDLQTQQARTVRELQSLRDTDRESSINRHQALDATLTQVKELEEQKQDSDKREKQSQDDINKLLGQLRDVRTKLSEEQAESDRVDGEYQSSINTLQSRIEDLEKTLAEGQSQKKTLQEDVKNLQNHVDDLEAKLQDQELEYSTNRGRWESQQRALESQKSKAEEQAAGLQRTIARLQEAEGSLSGKESQLQQALESEKKRYAAEERVLQEELREVSSESQHRLDELESTRSELSKVKRELQSSKVEVTTLQEKIQALEDEIEVLQCGLDDEAEQVKEDLLVVQEEADILQEQLARTQQQMKKKDTELNDAKVELAELRIMPSHSPLPVGTPAPQRELRKRVSELNEQITTMKKDRQDLQNRLFKAETAHAEVKADFDTLQLDLQTTSGSRSQLQQKLQDLQTQLSKAKKEKQDLQDSLVATNADLDVLQSSIASLESSRDDAQKQTRELRVQLQALQREQDRKHTGQLALYEQDIQNLEQDLAEATAKQENLTKANQSAEQQVSRLKTKIQGLESQLASARSSRLDHDTSAEERKDLHEMLKDAKLEAEDLALQIRERDSRVDGATAAESQLRAQLRRLREERAVQTARADAAARELERVQATHDRVVEEMSELRTQHRQVRFPKSTVTASGALAPPAELEKQTKRHAAELRGLVKQIEYLGARCRREEGFRRDLSYVKAYFCRQVEMYGKCTAADLRLVQAMGIPTDMVLAEQKEEGALMGPGRVEVGGSGRGRVSFRVLGLMVLAGVRLGRRAEGWRGVRREHEGLLKKLQGLRGARGMVVEEGGKVGKGRRSVK